MAEPSQSEVSPACREATHPNFVWRTIQFVMRLVFTVWLRYRARGLERIPASGGALFLVNHQSFLDPLLVQIAMKRPVCWLARENLFAVPFIGWVLRHTYVIPIDREAAGPSSVRTALDRMQQGFIVGIFPEGTRSEDGEIGPLKPGFATLVRRGRVPVIPVGVAGAFQALPRGACWLRPARVRIVFGEPLSEEEMRMFRQRRDKDGALEIARRRIVECQQQAEQWRRL